MARVIEHGSMSVLDPACIAMRQQWMHRTSSPSEDDVTRDFKLDSVTVLDTAYPIEISVRQVKAGDKGYGWDVCVSNAAWERLRAEFTLGRDRIPRRMELPPLAYQLRCRTHKDTDVPTHHVVHGQRVLLFSSVVPTEWYAIDWHCRRKIDLSPRISMLHKLVPRTESGSGSGASHGNGAGSLATDETPIDAKTDVAEAEADARSREYETVIRFAKGIQRKQVFMKKTIEAGALDTFALDQVVACIGMCEPDCRGSLIELYLTRNTTSNRRSWTARGFKDLMILDPNAANRHMYLMKLLQDFPAAEDVVNGDLVELCKPVTEYWKAEFASAVAVFTAKVIAKGRTSKVVDAKTRIAAAAARKRETDKNAAMKKALADAKTSGLKRAAELRKDGGSDLLSAAGVTVVTKKQKLDETSASKPTVFVVSDEPMKDAADCVVCLEKPPTVQMNCHCRTRQFCQGCYSVLAVKICPQCTGSGSVSPFVRDTKPQLSGSGSGSGASASASASSNPRV